MLETVDSLLPKCYNAIAFTGGAVGGAVAFAVGGIDVAVQWLFAFVVVDYLLGVAAACKTHVWSSSTGFKGIIKKAVIFSVVCVGNGLDQVLGTGASHAQPNKSHSHGLKLRSCELQYVLLSSRTLRYYGLNGFKYLILLFRRRCTAGYQ